jgi:beta-fructofuranosidase
VRPRFHITGERNWINDPNGPLHHDGVYHLFFQANPHAPFWGPPTWGHVTSTDLVTWRRHQPAVSPAAGTADADGCWSGCTRLVDGRPAIYYTGVVGEDGNRVESVCRAWGSDDLLTWEKDAANPLVAGPPAELGSGYHRDPFLWLDGDGWHMLLGSGTTEGERHGQIVRYDSPDATRWRFGGVFFEVPRSAGQLDLGEHWECPQLLFGDETAALVVSCQDPRADRPLMHSVYFVGAIRDGRFDGRLGGRLDHGDVFYAPALVRDESGRDLMWGWAQERLGPDRQAGLSHVGALTLPRQITLDGERLLMRPVPELDALRAERIAASGVAGEAQLELLATLEGADGTAGWALTAAGVRAEVLVDLSEPRLHVAVTDGSREPRVFGSALTTGDRYDLRLFVDGSLIEIFAGDGEAAITTRAYVESGGWDRADVRLDGDARVADATVWRLHDDVAT